MAYTPTAVAPPATILIVDDTPENLTVLGELLKPHYQVRIANSGRRALHIASTAPHPDIILLDVMMPGMDGYEVLAELQTDRDTQRIPVIFVTVIDDPQSEQKGLEAGAVDYITKPIQPTVALARVRTHLELKRARDLLSNQNLVLEAEIGRRMAENQRVQDVTILALARLAETRDPETGNHLRRTQEYVRVLAWELRKKPQFRAVLSDRVIELLTKSAPLHDIGKVGIPDAILLKPGKLTPEEWDVMRTHAELGFAALDRAERDVSEPIEFLALAKDIARHHHERWDGAGYPHRLVGEDIPFSARIMAVADVFDALISRRSYKEPLPFEKARAIVCGERGRHFDPDMIDAFDAVSGEFAAIAERYQDSEADVEAKLRTLSGPAVGASV